MNAQEILNALNGYDDVHNGDLTAIANDLIQLTEVYEQGLLTASEYKELVSDLQLEEAVTNEAADLNAKIQLKFIIDTAITLASIAASAI